MAANRAGVRIDGNAGGAVKAGKQTEQSLAQLTTAAKKAGQATANAARASTRSEKEFEAQVQKSIERLRKKQEAAKASAEASRRLGGDGGGGGGAGRIRGRMPTIGPAGGPAAGGGVGGRAAFQAAAQGMGGEFGRMGAALSSPVAALAAGAVAASMALGALTAASDKAAQAAADRVQRQQALDEATRAGREQLGATAMGAEQTGGQDLRALLRRGGDLAFAQGVMERTGTDQQTGTALANLVVGLPEETRKAIEAAYRDVRRGGGDAMGAARFAAEEARVGGGSLGSLSRMDLLMAGFGGAGSGEDRSAIVRAANAGKWGTEQRRLDQLQDFGNRGSRAAFETLSNPDAVAAANESTARGADRVRDPVAANIQDMRDAATKQIEVLEAQRDASFQMVELLKDISASFGRGPGSFGRQAAEARGRLP